MSESSLASLPWIADDAKRAKYEEKNDRVAIPDNPIVGVVTGHGRRDRFDKKGEYNVVTITLDDGREADIHCQATVLERQMLDARPKYGERISVAYLGEVQGANFASPYGNYKVKVDREPGGEIAWAGATTEEPVRVVYEQTAPQPPAPAPATPVSEAAPAQTQDDDDIPFD